MNKFTKLLGAAFLLLAGSVCASAQNAQEEDGEKVYASFASPSGITWDADNMTFSWSSQYGNQLHNIGLPNGNITEYSQLVVDCTILEGDGYRFMFYATDKGSTAGGTTIITESGKKVYNLADLGLDESYLTKCSEICLSGYNASGKVKVNSVYLIKSSDPLSGYKKLLTDAITAGKARNSYAKTEASWNALQTAITNGEAALAAADATQESLEAAAQAINNAIAGLKLVSGYSNLSTDMFHAWSSPDADATQTTDAVYPANEIGKSVGQGTTVWGASSVHYLQYADLTAYEQLVILGTPGFVARLCLNRAVPVEGGDSNGGAYIEIIETLNNEGVLVIDLKNYEKLQGVSYIHLNSFKTPWNGMTGMFSEVLLFHTPVVTPVQISPADGDDIAAALTAAKDNIVNGGDIVGDITITLTAGAAYTISSSIEAPASVTINGNGATIDASALSGAFVQMSATPSVAANNKGAYEIDGVAIKDVVITGLAYQLVYANKTNYLMNEVLVDNSVVGMMGAAKKTFFDFNGGGNTLALTVNKSTLWTDATTTHQNGGFYSSQAGKSVQDLKDDATQKTAITNSTLYNISYKCTTSSRRKNSQDWITYEVKNSIIVNSGKSGQFLKGLNAGQAGKDSEWDVDGNAFNFDGANIAEQNVGATEGNVKNSIAGVITFTDAAVGNFNGTFELATRDAVAPQALGDPRWTITYTKPHTWDFTKWSTETVDNLKADAAASKTEGWSDVEKKADAEADADPTELSKDNCFWFAGTATEGVLSANGQPIKELEGLYFWNNSYNSARSLAIAVNYQLVDASKDFGPYNGPSYLWLGGKEKDCFVIASVKCGTTITMGVESHKITDARGIQLKVDGTVLAGPNAPKTYTEQSWQVPGESGVVDVTVYNTNGCHIYFIDAEIDKDVTTGIQTATTNTTANDNVIYDLQGRRVQNAQSGLYIVNGRKVVIK